MKNDLKLNPIDEFMAIEISQEKLDLLARLADESAVWIKLVEGGFLIDGEKTVRELQGVLVSVNPYYVMWEDKKPHKIPFEGQEAPEGHELRCDIKLNVNGTLIGLSLPKTSTKAHLAQYLKFLKQSGIQINNVVTRVRSKTVTSPHGKFCVAVFDCVGGIDDLQAPPATPDPNIIDIQAMKAETPQPVQTSSNPWA
jgi:hypothetical protein